MKHLSKNSWRRTLLALSALSAGLFANLVHAYAYYDAHADALLSINAITNLTTGGNLGATLIDGTVFVDNEGVTEYGNVETANGGTIDLQSSTASDPGLLIQTSDTHGNVYPQHGIQSLADTVFISLGEFNRCETWSDAKRASRVVPGSPRGRAGFRLRKPARPSDRASSQCGAM